MASPAAATVLIPTHDHGETLRYSVQTALQQSISDIEVLIVGDGVPDVARQIARELETADSRVRFFDFPKGPSRGELHRHTVLQHARGDIVCYLLDDDLWLPDHVAVMLALLEDADFAFSLPVIVRPDGSQRAFPVNLADAVHRKLFTHPRSGTGSTPTCAAHTLEMYRRLPFGWRTTPPGLAPDKFMWAQFLGVPGCRTRSTLRPTAVIFPDPPRRDWPLPRRLAELERWSQKVADPEGRRQFIREVVEETESHAMRPSRLMAALYLSALFVPGGRRLLVPLGRRLFGGRRPAKGGL